MDRIVVIARADDVMPRTAPQVIVAIAATDTVIT